MKQFKVVSLYFFLIVNLFSGLQVNAKSIVAADIVEGQQYVPNFLKQKGHFEKNANGISAYADAAGTRPVNGSGGAPTLSCTRTTSSPIDGDGSLLITKDAANRQGQGCSIQFTIDSAYKAKVLQIEFDYLVASGTFTAGSSSADSDLIAYIYDVTNSTLIEPSSIKLLSNSSTISDHFVANFQTSATGTTYNLILHQATTSASAYTVKADNFQVKPSQYVYGTPISDWVAYTPTGSWTNTTYAGKWRRVGDTMEVNAQLTLLSAPGAATLTVNIPTGYSIDTAKLANSTQYDAGLGVAHIRDFSGNFYTASTRYNNTTSVLFTINSGGIITEAVPMTWTSADQLTARFEIPITGWSSSTQVSDGYDGRLINGIFALASATHTSTGNWQTLPSSTWTTVKDSTASFLNGTYTIPSSGDYRVSGAVVFAANGTGIRAARIIAGGTTYPVTSGIAAHALDDNFCLLNQTIPNLKAGDTIVIQGYQNSGGNLSYSTNATRVIIEKLQSPTTISATEVVAARYTTTNNQSLSGAATTIVNYEVKTHSTHDSVTVGAGTWNFKAPVSGFYKVQASIRAQAKNYSTGDNMVLYIYKNGVEYGWLGNWTAHTNLTSFPAYMGDSDTVQLNAGETLDVRVFTNTTINLDNNSGRSHINIERIK